MNPLIHNFIDSKKNNTNRPPPATAKYSIDQNLKLTQSPSKTFYSNEVLYGIPDLLLVPNQEATPLPGGFNCPSFLISASISF